MADPWNVVLVIGGQTVTTLGRVRSVHITDQLTDAPNTATLTTQAQSKRPASAPFLPAAFDAGAFNVAPVESLTFRPHAGAPIAIYLGTISPETLLFGGEMTVVQQIYEADRPEHVAYHLSCVDYTRRGNRKKVVKHYGPQSATLIVQDVIATYTDLTATQVQTGLPSVDGGISLTFEDVSRSLSRIAERIGASWYWDYLGDLHFFIDEPGAAPAPIVPGGAPFDDFQIATDLTQIRTRILVEGLGSTVLANILAGSSVIPIADGSMFPASGLAKLGPIPQRVSYAGVVLGGAAGSSVGVPQAAIPGIAAVQAAGIDGGLVGGPYHWLWTAVAERDESNYLGISGPVTISDVFKPVSPGGSVTQANAAGTLLTGGNSYGYWMTYRTADGGETTATAIGSLAPTAVAIPPTNYITGLAATTGGSIEPGTFRYGMTYVTATGETGFRDPGAASVLVAAPNNAVQLSGIVVPTDVRVKAKRIYRWDGLGPNWRLMAELAPPVTAMKDTIPSTSLGGINPPSATDTDGAAAELSSLRRPSDPRVTGRRLYRTVPSGAGATTGRQIADLNLTDTTYIDTGREGSGVHPPSASTANGGAADVTVPAGPAGTTARKLYRTKSGDPAYRFVQTISGNTAATVRDTKADTATGDPYIDTTTWPTPAGSTSLGVTDLAGFPSSGWIRVANQTISYGSRSAAAGPGSLTGIPSTGRGAILAPVSAGSIVSVAPQLTGVSGLAHDLNLGDEVHLLVVEDDVAAQAALAALEGGDGILEHYIQDQRLSVDGARARARADLALFKTVETTITYVTWDPQTRSGKTVHVDLPAPTLLTGDFLIQSVTIDAIDQFRAGPSARLYPRRRVTASSTRFTFENVLQRLLMEDR